MNGDNESFQVKKVTIWKILTGIFGVLFVASLFTGGFGLGANEGTGSAVVAPTAPLPTAPSQGPDPNVRQDVKYDGAPVKGDKDAKVTIVEFSDFQCPFCGRFYEQTLPSIQKEYIDTGKVKLAFRHLPLSFHEYAMPAAEASECANEQGKFWEYHDKIFTNQPSLSNEILSTWAKDVGLDTDKFDKCMKDGNYKSKIQKDLNDASVLGASGTPTFFINGKILVGAQPFTAFKQAIDAELSA
ncbi:DsbA family protein [Candidatus Woesearchaeota archaeon]|nr:DsbA family protein [Candidatus Woesearchaeota archaeon]